MSKQTNVGCEFVSRDAKGREGREDVEVDVAGVGLAGDLEGRREAGSFRDEVVQLFAL